MVRKERETSQVNPEEIKLISTERLTIASKSFGQPYSNDDLVSRLPVTQKDLANEIVTGTGMTRRFLRYLDSMSSPEQVVEDAVTAICTLVESAMKERGWKHLDHLIVTSAFLPTQISRLALRKLNMSEISYQDYRLACAGAVTGFVDSLLNEHLAGKNVALVSAEPLSALIDERHFTPENLHIPAIFGDMYSVLCYNTDDFIIPHDENGPLAKVVFIPDHGVIKLTPWYQLKNPGGNVPSYYQFAEGAKEITSINNNEVTMALFGPDQGLRVSMNGQATAKHFIRHTPPIIREILERSFRMNTLPSQAVYHQPSQPVNQGIERALGRNSAFPLPPMKFTLGEIGQSNSSSATSIIAWQALIERNLFNHQEPFLICAPGIGSAITAATVIPRV
jgi:3-oxoacyl-[acyl-carrier-protein] synthase III